MSKDHKPGGFNRLSGYKSDLEISEEKGVKINTSFGSGNHNAYIHNENHTHEHYWYDPSRLRSGYHGENFATKNNHPIKIEAITNENKESICMADDKIDVEIENGEECQCEDGLSL